MKTTLNKIRRHGPCDTGWKKLLRNLGKTKADNEPLSITTILDSNGLDDALWCLRAVNGYQREMRLFAVDCARSVQRFMKDKRSIAALDVAERHAYGLITNAELAVARNASSDAADFGTAWAAAWHAAKAEAWGAASRASVISTAWGSDRNASMEVQADLLRIVCAEIEQRGNHD